MRFLFSNLSFEVIIFRIMAGIRLPLTTLIDLKLMIRGILTLTTFLEEGCSLLEDHENLDELVATHYYSPFTIIMI